MNQNYANELERLLSENEKYVVEGKLNKNIIAELAHKHDAGLIDLLASHAAMRKLFFTETGAAVLVFDKDKFMQFISNQAFLPDSYTAYKNKIGLAVGSDELLSETKQVVLNWPYKDAILEGGQDKEDAKRNEVFFNETLAPDQISRLLDDKVFVGWKRLDKTGEHPLGQLQPDDNLILKGNNLVVLHSLQKRFAGSVKLIYIDPPYYFEKQKSGDTFSYNSNFKLSTWLTFMRNRLQAAKTLLRPDGVIFIQISDDGLGHLKVLLDEVFAGDGSFINLITVKAKSSAGASGGGEDRRLKKNAEYLLVYGLKDFRSFNKVYEVDYLEDLIQQKIRQGKDYEYKYLLLGEGTRTKFGQITLGSGEHVDVYKHNDYKIVSVKDIAKAEGLDVQAVYKKYLGRIFRVQDSQSSIRAKVSALTKGDDGLFSIQYVPKSGKHKGTPTTVRYFKGEQVNDLTNVTEIIGGQIMKKTILGSLWKDIGWDGIANEGGVRLKAGKKPEKLLARIIEMSTQKGDLVLDYHLGSGTTAAVAHKMGRRYIGIEQLDYGAHDALVRLQNVMNGDPTGVSKAVGWQGGGSLVQATLKNDAEDFRSAVRQAVSDKILTELLETAKKSSFLSYRVDPAKLGAGSTDFANLSLAHKKQLLLELVDSNTLYVNYSDIDDTSYGIGKQDKKHNHDFYKKLRSRR